MAGRDEVSLARRFLLWFIRLPPFSPDVATSSSADGTSALAYLERPNSQGHEQRISLQRLVTAAVARTYSRFPDANSSVRGSRIGRHRHVGVVMPVSLLKALMPVAGARSKRLEIVQERVSRSSRVVPPNQGS